MVSVLTLNKNRTNHLSALIESLNRSSQHPKELIIIEMSDKAESFSSPYFAINTIKLNSEELNLAQARNKAAQATNYEKLLFLDVDCLAARNFVQIMSHALDKYKALICCEAFYLPQNAINYSNLDLPDEDNLVKMAKKDPRFFCEDKFTAGSFETFWSLAFATTKTIFNHIGGFCEDFVGYGGEDTEFAYRAAMLKNIPNIMCAKTKVFHQYHGEVAHQYQHFHSIIKNFELFYKIYGIWLNSPFLEQYEKDGFITWHDDHIEILKQPQLDKLINNEALVR